MRRFLDYWYVPLFAIAAVLVWIFIGRKSPRPAIVGELRAIKETALVREIVAKQGAEYARSEVRRAHATTIETLSKQQAAEAEALAQDPVALAKFLVKAAQQ